MRTFGAVTRTPVAWVVDALPHVHLRAKRVFGKLSKQAQHKLVLSHSPETCRDLEWFLERFPMEMSAADRGHLAAGAAQYRDRGALLERFGDPGYVPPSYALALPLRDYQARETALYLASGSLLNADDVGLGKTVNGVASFTDPRTLPALVVTLTHLTRQWRREIAKFLPHLNVHICKSGTPYELPRFMGRGPDVVILNYHKLSGWSKALAGVVRSAVFDEIQELRHDGSAKYRAAADLCAELDFRLGLSATPIFNYGGEIYNVLDVLKPGCLGARGEFATEWLAGDVMKDPKAFGAWARDEGLIVRHTRKDVGRELPKVTRVIQDVDCDAAALDAVGDSAGALARIIMGLAGAQPKGAAFQASQELSNLLRQATGVAKAPYVADFVRLLVESGECPVVFAWHRAVYGILMSKLKDLEPLLYTGTESPAAKERAIADFVEGAKRTLKRPLLMSLRSGAGVNGLERVSSVGVFAELDWSPGVHRQCVGRLDRDGQQVPVMAYFLVSDQGSDPVVAEVNGIKNEQLEGIRNPTLTVIEELETDPAHARRLAAFYLARHAPTRSEAGASRS